MSVNEVARWDAVTKSYGNVTAVEKVSLALHAGEVLALVGHNGAGKTTLIKLLLGFVRPNAGDVSISQLDPAGRDGARARRAVGFLPENVAFHAAMTGRELMRFYAHLKRAPVSHNNELLERVGISHAADRRVGTYSKGMRQRLGVAQALIGRPQLLVFDEPTSGLDPASRSDVYEMIDALRTEGATVLLSTHGLAEVEQRVDRVAIMHAGSLHAVGTLEQLRSNSRSPVRIVVRTRPSGTDQVLAALPPGVTCAKRTDSALTLLVSPDAKLEVLRAMLTDDAMRNVVQDVDAQSPGLQELYRELTGVATEEDEMGAT